jgi:hypothetical protein
MVAKMSVSVDDFCLSFYDDDDRVGRSDDIKGPPSSPSSCSDFAKPRLAAMAAGTSSSNPFESQPSGSKKRNREDDEVEEGGNRHRRPRLLLDAGLKPPSTSSSPCRRHLCCFLGDLTGDEISFSFGGRDLITAPAVEIGPQGDASSASVSSQNVDEYRVPSLSPFPSLPAVPPPSESDYYHSGTGDSLPTSSPNDNDDNGAYANYTDEFLDLSDLSGLSGESPPFASAADSEATIYYPSAESSAGSDDEDATPRNRDGINKFPYKTLLLNSSLQLNYPSGFS